MSISYPVVCPTHLAPNAVRWSIVSSTALSTSPTTYQQTRYEFDGEIWQIDVSYPPLKRDEAAPFFAFLASLRGVNGTFLFGDTLLGSTQGTSTGTPRVNGANQARAKVLISDGWTSSTLVLKAGDFFEVDGRCYMSLTDVTSDASGNASIDVFPRLRNHADNATVVTVNPRGTFRLTNDQQTIVEVGNNQFFSISFQAREAI